MVPKPRACGLPAVLCLVVVLASPAACQCILANPSFEIGASGSPVFGGWNQFGAVGSVSDAVHGSAAARVSGPDAGGWDVSGFWQSQDCAPGERWDVTGHVRHTAGKPLIGQCAALVNVEWRNAAGDLIDYDSFTVADAASPVDAYAAFAVTSAPAPAGTVEARLLLGVLQSPSDPAPDVHYDQITFFSTTPPTTDDVQWNDFPGGASVVFAGRTWRVKGPGVYGPGGNYFSDAAEAVWVDDRGLHLTNTNLGWTWAATEVVADEALGYGDYVLTTEGRLDQIDPQTVLGMFLWEYGTCWSDGYLWWNAFNEVDIEYSRWGVPANGAAQFVAQPYDSPGNIERFDPTFAEGEVVSHAIRWLADRVEYRVWRGELHDESPATTIHAWTYAGPHVPRPEQPRLHLNFWKLSGTPAGDQEVVFKDFAFIPVGATTGVGDERTASPVGRLAPAAPNPFNPATVIAYDLDHGGDVSLTVFDVKGRLVRTLASGRHDAGTHAATWDGRDDRGVAMGSGVYMVRLLGDDFAESRRLVLAK